MDAGYLLAAGGHLCCGTNSRRKFRCDYEALIRDLGRYVQDISGMDLLRVYWYDGAVNGELKEPDHRLIAGLRNVKLRLGRLQKKQQKGVDSLIVRDLMVLARERAISTAFVLSGDEDIRIRAFAAQDMGLRVGLIGIGSDRPNQAETLIFEADEHHVIGKSALQKHFELLDQMDISSLQTSPEDVGAEFAHNIADLGDVEEIADLLAGYPRIPRDTDSGLLKYATKKLELPTNSLPEDIRKRLRDGFWDALRIRAESIGGE